MSVETELKELQSDIRSLSDKVQSSCSDFDKRICLLESAFRGDSGILQLIERQGHVLEVMNLRLTKIEHGSELMKVGKSEAWKRMGVLFAIVALIFNIGFNFFYILGG